jgi:hypothetical protein
VVALEPGLGAEELMLRHQEDDVLRPVDLGPGEPAQELRIGLDRDLATLSSRAMPASVFWCGEEAGRWGAHSTRASVLEAFGARRIAYLVSRYLFASLVFFL